MTQLPTVRPWPELPTVRPWRRRLYLECLAAMREFTAQRGPDTPDEIWLVEHEPVYTQGLAGRA
jgi:lipoyl(octanoyl) transferase